ncbi:unnamed protein product, partial [Tetraodon nigroviridis]
VCIRTGRSLWTSSLGMFLPTLLNHGHPGADGALLHAPPGTSASSAPTLRQRWGTVQSTRAAPKQAWVRRRRPTVWSAGGTSSVFCSGTGPPLGVRPWMWSGLD